MKDEDDGMLNAFALVMKIANIKLFVLLVR